MCSNILKTAERVDESLLWPTILFPRVLHVALGDNGIGPNWVYLGLWWPQISTVGVPQHPWHSVPKMKIIFLPLWTHELFCNYVSNSEIGLWRTVLFESGIMGMVMPRVCAFEWETAYKLASCALNDAWSRICTNSSPWKATWISTVVDISPKYVVPMIRSRTAWGVGGGMEDFAIPWPVVMTK